MASFQQRRQNNGSHRSKRAGARPALALAPLAAILLSVGLGQACYLGPSEPTPTPTLVPADIPTPLPPTPTPEPTPTSVPQLQVGDAIIVGGEVRTRPVPSTRNIALGALPHPEPVAIVAVVQGENWLVGEQTGGSASPPWGSGGVQVGGGG